MNGLTKKREAIKALSQLDFLTNERFFSLVTLIQRAKDEDVQRILDGATTENSWEAETMPKTESIAVIKKMMRQ